MNVAVSPSVAGVQTGQLGSDVRGVPVGHQAGAPVLQASQPVAPDLLNVLGSIGQFQASGPAVAPAVASPAAPAGSHVADAEWTSLAVQYFIHMKERQGSQAAIARAESADAQILHLNEQIVRSVEAHGHKLPYSFVVQVGQDWHMYDFRRTETGLAEVRFVTEFAVIDLNRALADAGITP